MGVPAAAAQADDTWMGASTASKDWSVAANWSSGVPTSSPGTLTFGSCAPSPGCYTSLNDLSGVSPTGLVFSNTAGTYQIDGNGLTLEGGGITANVGGPGNVINAPLTLGANQTWSIGAAGSAYNSVSLTGQVTGSSSLE